MIIFKRYCLRLIPAVLLCLIRPAAHAEIVGGETAMPFMVAPRSAAYTGMGGASYASASSVATGVFSNPSVIPYYQGKFDAAASYMSWMPEIDVMPIANVSASARLNGRIGITAGGVYMDYGTPSVSALGAVYPGESGRNIIFGAGAGIRIVGSLTAGANVRYVSQSLGDYSIEAIVFDAMASYRISGFIFTGGVRNFGYDVEDAYSVKYKLPSSAVVGAGYEACISRDHVFEALLDVDCPFAGGSSVAVGGRYTLSGILTLRAGYRHATEGASVPSFASTGIGLHWKNVSIDGAYIFGSEVLQNSFIAGLRLSF